MATAKQGTCCKTLLFPKFEACVIQPSTRTSYKSSGNFLAASNMKQGQTSWNVLITSKDSSLEEIGSNDKSICRGWLAIMPCKDVGKAADSADLPKPTDTETLVVFFAKKKCVQWLIQQCFVEVFICCECQAGRSFALSHHSAENAPIGPWHSTES